MKTLISLVIAMAVSACALDMGRQSEVYNSKDIFARHEQNLHLTDIKP